MGIIGGRFVWRLMIIPRGGSGWVGGLCCGAGVEVDEWFDGLVLLSGMEGGRCLHVTRSLVLGI